MDLIATAHEVTGGHCGVTKTRKSLTSRCYWEQMTVDVKEFIKNCDRCQRSRPNKLMKGSDDLHPIPVPSKVWCQVGIDIMTMKTVDGYKYIITAMDYFSKNMEMRALKAKTAKNVAIFLYEEVICRWGSPDVIITDQGREFCNTINEELMKRACCKHRITSAYHPQSNGLVERQNRSTTQFLLKNMDCQDDWVQMIPTMMASHRHTVHSTTNIEPSAMLLGRKPTLAVDMMLKNEEFFNRELEDYEIEEIESRDYGKVLKNFNLIKGNMYDDATENISAAQVKMKKYYDIRHSSDFKYSVGDRVLKRECKNLQRKGGKHDIKFSGLYTIQEITDLGLVCLKTDKGKLLAKHVPTKHLQKYNEKVTESVNVEEFDCVNPTESVKVEEWQSVNMTESVNAEEWQCVNVTESVNGAELQSLKVTESVNLEVKESEKKCNIRLTLKRKCGGLNERKRKKKYINDIERNRGDEEKEKDDVEFVKIDEGTGIEFIPITDTTRQHVLPMFGILNVEQCTGPMPCYVLGGVGKGSKLPESVFSIRGDGNCLFRSISYILTGYQEYFAVMREGICNYVLNHYSDLKPFCEFANGHEYLKAKGMRNDGVWGTEIEILATANMAQRDVVVFNKNGYLRYKCSSGPTYECFFLDNRGGGHFDVIKSI